MELRYLCIGAMIIWGLCERMELCPLEFSSFRGPPVA